VSFIAIEMEWTYAGAIVKASMPINCPRCGVLCTSNLEHRCGDKIKSPPKAKAKRKAVNP